MSSYQRQHDRPIDGATRPTLRAGFSRGTGVHGGEAEIKGCAAAAAKWLEMASLIPLLTTTRFRPLIFNALMQPQLNQGSQIMRAPERLWLPE